MRNTWRTLVVLYILTLTLCDGQALVNNGYNTYYSLTGDGVEYNIVVNCPPNGVPGHYLYQIAFYGPGNAEHHEFDYSCDVILTGTLSTFSDGSSTINNHGFQAICGGEDWRGGVDFGLDQEFGHSTSWNWIGGFYITSPSFLWASPIAGAPNVYWYEPGFATITCMNVADSGSYGGINGAGHPYTGKDVGAVNMTLTIPVPPDSGTIPASVPPSFAPTATASSGGSTTGGNSSSTTSASASGSGGSVTVNNNNNASVSNTSTSTSTVNNSGGGGTGSSSVENNNNSIVNTTNNTTNYITNNYGTNSGSGTDETITAGTITGTSTPTGSLSLADQSYNLSEATNNAAAAQGLGDALATVVTNPLVSSDASFGTMPDPVMNFWGHTQTIPISSWRPVTNKFRELILLVLLIWFWFRVASMLRGFLQSI